MEGKTLGALNRIFVFKGPMNISFTNNNFIDFAWDVERYGIVSGYVEISCNEPFRVLGTYENNTFRNTIKMISRYPL